MQNTDLRSFDLTQRTVFGLLSQTLFGAAYTPEPDVDWTAVFRESECQAVRLQTFANYHLIPGIPTELRADIKQYILGAMLKDARVHAQHTMVHNLLTAHHISYSILKGASSASYYPNALTRAMGDVDFYVDRADLDRAIELFSSEGFEISGLDHICHVILRKGSIHLEMHFAPAGIPEGKSGEIIRSYLMDLREKTTLLQNETVTCRLPSPFHHGLIMLMHLQHHLLAEGIGLRHLCDWAVFVNRFVGSEFPDTFQKRLKAVGLWRFARLLSLSASLYIGLPEQAWMREEAGDEELAAALMRDLLNGGNFGAKNRQRGYEGMFISNRGKNGVQNNRCKELCSSVNRITKQKYPVMKKIPLLLPFGWLFTVVGYFFHNGKRKKKNSRVSMVEAYRNSEPRRQLYRQFHLYEPES